MCRIVIHRIFDNCFNLAGVTVQLSSTQLSVTEGDSGTTSLDLCVQLTNIQNSLDRDVPLLVNTQTSSAGEKIRAV